jgi:hypothetical protein
LVSIKEAGKVILIQTLDLEPQISDEKRKMARDCKKDKGRALICYIEKSGV